MAYSFPKFSFLIGVILIVVISSQLHFRSIPNIPKEHDLKTIAERKAQTLMCSKTYPHMYKQVRNLIPQLKEIITDKILLIATVSSLALMFIFNMIPKKGFFTWTFSRLFTTILLVFAIACGYLYMTTFESQECEVVKGFVLDNKLKSLNFETIKENPYVKMILAKVYTYIPEICFTKFNQFKDVFFSIIDKLGVQSPIFVIIIALYLVNEKNAKVTKNSVLIVVAFIISLLTGLTYYQTTQDLIFSLVFPLIFIILSYIIVNLMFRFGYLFVASKYLFSCYVLAFRIAAVVFVFNKELDFPVAIGFFIFFFANVFLWSSGSYLTIVYLLNFGLKQLFDFPADSLVVLVFLLHIFIGEKDKKAKQPAPKPTDKKVKQD